MKRLLWIALIVLGTMSCKKEDDVILTQELSCWRIHDKDLKWSPSEGYKYEFYLRKGDAIPGFTHKTIVISKSEWEANEIGDQYCE